MKCRSCGAEIDAKAIVCYRCGAATTDPAALPTRAVPPNRRMLWVVVVAVIVAAVTVYLLYFRPV